MSQTYAVDPSRALPASAYRDEISYAAEQHAIWRNDWVFVGTVDQVAEPGDHFPTLLGGQPIIVLRRQDGTLTAVSNLCAHRGTLLVDAPGNTKRFQCPYHAWTYADDGRLLSVPHASRDEVDRDAHCLPHYRAEEWHGLVFASMANDGPTVAQRLAHLDGFMADAGIANLHHWTAERTDEVWNANWKLVLSNAMESYHLFKVHPETLEPYTPTADAYYLVGCADGTATGGASKGQDDYVLLSLPPNLVAVISGGNLLWQAVEPLATDRTRIIAGGAYAHPSPSTSSGLSKLMGKAASKAAEMAIPDFLPEDKAICERGQIASSGDFEPGVIVPMEHVITDFHHYLARQLHGAEVPDVRTSAEVGVAKATS